MKMNTGCRRWSESTPYPPWDAVQKCPLWSAEEWKAVKTALSKPVPTVDVELTDNKVVVLRNTGIEATNEDDDDTGTKILIYQSSRAVVCQLPSQQDLTQRCDPFLVDCAVYSRFCPRNALQRILPPNWIKMGLSDRVLIVDSLGIGTRWYRGHSSPYWQVAHERHTHLNDWQAWGRETHWSLAQGPGRHLGMAMDEGQDI